MKHPSSRRPAIFIKAEGNRYKTREWSPGSFRLDDYHRTLRPRDKIAGVIALGRFGRSGEFLAEVVGPTRGEGIGFRILEVSGTVFGAMSGSYR